jgi:outer membrane protein assembly factor BamB
MKDGGKNAPAGVFLMEFDQNSKPVQQKPKWLIPVEPPVQVEAILLSGDVLFAAGPNDYVHRAKGGFLWAFSAKDGNVLKKLKLEYPPVYDGMAAANGKLFVTLQNGKVFCFGK